MSEYSNQSSSGTCSYATLSSYNGKQQGTMETPPPTGSSQYTSGLYVVPMYSAISYDSLTHGNTGCSNMLSITDAYGADANKCNQKYEKRKCNWSQN